MKKDSERHRLPRSSSSNRNFRIRSFSSLNYFFPFVVKLSVSELTDETDKITNKINNSRCSAFA